MPIKVLTAGLTAGLVAAVVFASATTGPLPVRLFLFILTPLPMYLVGFGFGWRAAAVAGIFGALVIGVLAAPQAGIGFALTQAIPCVALTYLALLSRPMLAADGTVQSVQWYPTGRLVLWAGLLSALITIAILMFMGSDLDSLRATLRSFMETLLTRRGPGTENMPQPTAADIDQVADVAFRLLPSITAISVMGGTLFNLYLAGRIALGSGQLSRPWPDLAALAFPAGTAALLLLAISASYLLTGYAGLAAGAFSGALYLAFVVLGLAILHYTLRGNPWRPFVLFTLYMLIIFNFAFSLIAALIALAEPFAPYKRNPNAQPPKINRDD